MENLYGWLFSFNPETGNWRDCTRDQYLDMFSKPETEFLRSDNINHLIALIMKHKGDVETLNKLI
mgnify:CR=1 FL=1